MNVWCTVALTVLTLGFTACSDSTEEEVAVDPGIVGEWKIASAQFLYDEQDPAIFVKNLADSLGTSVEALEKAGMKTSLENNTAEEIGVAFRFDADKAYEILYPDEETGEMSSETDKGTWSVTDKNVLILEPTKDSNSNLEFEVRSITRNGATLAYVRHRTKADIMDFYKIEVAGGISTTSLLYLKK